MPASPNLSKDKELETVFTSRSYLLHEIAMMHMMHGRVVIPPGEEGKVRLRQWVEAGLFPVEQVPPHMQWWTNIAPPSVDGRRIEKELLYTIWRIKHFRRFYSGSCNYQLVARRSWNGKSYLLKTHTEPAPDESELAGAESVTGG